MAKCQVGYQGLGFRVTFQSGPKFGAAEKQEGIPRHQQRVKRAWLPRQKLGRGDQ
jgi:hypothetical protein